MTKIQKHQVEWEKLALHSVIEQNINISKYKHLSGSSCIKLLEELNYSAKGLINIQNSDNNECFMVFSQISTKI